MGKTKYIDANKVIDYANQEVTAAFYYPQDGQRKRDEQAYREKWAFVKQVMVGMPAADVTEVKRGRWDRSNPHWDYENKYVVGRCSNCGFSVHEITNYCPNCGAKMERSEENE